MNIKAITVLETLTIPVAAPVTSLAKGSTFSVEATGPVSLYCISGALWATVSGNPADLLVQAGETKRIEGRGRLLVSAFETSRFWIG
ncbi:MAG: DUF2917 domain-containing protein [Spirochaetota bacterium]